MPDLLARLAPPVRRDPRAVPPRASLAPPVPQARWANPDLLALRALLVPWVRPITGSPTRILHLKTTPMKSPPLKRIG